MINVNRLFIFFISLLLMPVTGLLTIHVINEYGKENHHINELQDVINVCEDLNWEASSLHYNLKSLDWYIGTMVEDGLMSIEEGNNTIYRFIMENIMTSLEIEDRSGINDHSEFKNNPNIMTEYYIIDLYDENYFTFNYTYELLINEYGENTKLFTFLFEAEIMEDIVENIKSATIDSLEKIRISFSILIGLFGFSITALGIKEIVEEEKERKEEIEYLTAKINGSSINKGNVQENRSKTWIIPVLVFLISLCFFLYPFILYLQYFLF